MDLRAVEWQIQMLVGAQHQRPTWFHGQTADSFRQVGLDFCEQGCSLVRRDSDDDPVESAAHLTIGVMDQPGVVLAGKCADSLFESNIKTGKGMFHECVHVRYADPAGSVVCGLDSVIENLNVPAFPGFDHSGIPPGLNHFPGR